MLQIQGASTPLSCKRKAEPPQKCFIWCKNFALRKLTLTHGVGQSVPDTFLKILLNVGKLVKHIQEANTKSKWGLTHTNSSLSGRGCCPKSSYSDSCLRRCCTAPQNQPLVLAGDSVHWTDHQGEGMICGQQTSTLSTEIITITTKHWVQVKEATYNDSSSKYSWSHSSLWDAPLISDQTKTPWGEEQRKTFRVKTHTHTHTLYNQQHPNPAPDLWLFLFLFPASTLHRGILKWEQI